MCVYILGALCYLIAPYNDVGGQQQSNIMVSQPLNRVTVCIGLESQYSTINVMLEVVIINIAYILYI